MSERFISFCGQYKDHFQLPTHHVGEQAQHYLSGLVQADRKNMERMAEVVPESDSQALQNFLSDSRWDERAVLDQVALEADKRIGGNKDTAFILDESGFTKKGKCSVGVARQYNGRLGKVDNCQVGVFASLTRKNRTTLIDKQLFLPECWADDSKRCDKVRIPTARQHHQTKPELALEMVRYNRKLGVRFGWVGMDALYGNTPSLLRSLEEDGEVFVADVHKSQKIYLEDPQPVIPKRKGNRGRHPTKAITQSESVNVAEWMESQQDSQWKKIELRKGTKGRIIVEVLHQKVWLWDGKESQARHWHLIVRREFRNPDDIKYSLSNAPESTSIRRLAKMQGQRYWVERSFQDGKSEVGMSDYQARGWRSWNCHMVLVMMAMLFMLNERITQVNEYPLLSCSDITTLLSRFLPRRDIDPNEIIRQLEIRHKNRQSSIDSAYRNQQLE